MEEEGTDGPRKGEREGGRKGVRRREEWREGGRSGEGGIDRQGSSACAPTPVGAAATARTGAFTTASAINLACR
jgi:hypothetical protein